MEVLALSQLIPSAPHALPQPHVILTQGVPPNSYAVLSSACGTGQLQIHNRQFAHLLPGRIVGEDITRLAVPEEHQHRPMIIQMAGRTYFPDDPVYVQMGIHITILISAVDVHIYTEQVVDAFLA